MKNFDLFIARDNIAIIDEYGTVVSLLSHIPASRAYVAGDFKFRGQEEDIADYLNENGYQLSATNGIYTNDPMVYTD